MRTPIYAGLLNGMLGTALATNLIGLVVALLTGCFCWLATIEERNLARTFPDSCPAYRASAKMFIPAQAVDAIQTTMAGIHFPSGYDYLVTGANTQQASAFSPLETALELSPLLVYMLLAALCESLVLPLCVLLAVPLATAGAFCTLVWAGQTLNLFSLIGLLMLIGLVSKNAILLVDRAEHLRREGLSAKEAVVTAARHRLRPILMTTITVVIAMLPIALVSSAGSEDRTPMALVLVGGMTSSTLLTLVVVPTLYTYLDAIRRHLPPTPCARRGRLRALVRGDGARTPPHPVPAPK